MGFSWASRADWVRLGWLEGGRGGGPAMAGGRCGRAAGGDGLGRGAPLRDLWARASERPGSPAVAGLAGGTLSAGELWSRAHGAAQALRGHATSPLEGRAVLLGGPGEAEEPLPQLVLLLAAGLAGAWFAPVDVSEWPVRRLAEIRGQCDALLFVVPSGAPEAKALEAVAGSPCVVRTYEDILGEIAPERLWSGSSDNATGAHDLPPPDLLPAWGGKVQEEESSTSEEEGGGDENKAQWDYCYFTSGTTGTPKGVLGTFAQVARYARGKAKDEGLGQGSRVLLASSFTFDPFLGDAFAALLSGAVLCLSDRLNLHLQMAQVIADHHATHVCCTPAVWSLAGSVRDLEECGLRKDRDGVPTGDSKYSRDVSECLNISLGGETMSQAMIDEWAPFVKLRNVYGTTEACVYQCSQLMGAGVCMDPRRIGRPMEQSELHVLDPQTLEEVPAGCKGEIFIGGDTLSCGYLNEAEMTSFKFLLHPTKGRLYRTGDLARVHDGPERGAVEILGRQDLEVKINGIRIDLGEVHSVLEKCTLVSQARALVTSGGQIAVYIVLKGGLDGRLSDSAVRCHLECFLPSYSVPKRLQYIIDPLPVSINGKIDTSRLSEMKSTSYEVSESVTKFHHPIEATIGSLWASLGLQVSSRNDDFHRLGGDSLAALRFLKRLRNELRTKNVERVSTSAEPDEVSFGEIKGTFSAEEFLSRPVLKHYAAFIGQHINRSSSIETNEEQPIVDMHFRRDFLRAIEKGCLRIVESFLSSIPDLAVSGNHNEFKPLHVAAIAGNVAIAKILMSCGARPYSVTDMGVTPAHVAAAEKNAGDMIAFLIEAGTSPLVKDRNKQTLTHFAARAGRVENISCISDAGCQLQSQDRWGRTPLHWAILNGHPEFVAALIELGCIPNNVKKSRRAGKERVTRLVKETPLDLAWRKFPHDVKLMSLLLNAGATGVCIDEVRKKNPS